MKNHRRHVMLSVAKNPREAMLSGCSPQMLPLRFTQG